MRHSRYRIAHLCGVLIFLCYLRAAPFLPGQSACEQIKTACVNAGFMQGAARSGVGLYHDCIDPILGKHPRSRITTKSLPKVDPKIVAACKAQDLNYGTPAASVAVPVVPPPSTLPATSHKALASSPQHPNIVFILTDDLSMNLVQFMPHVLEMEKQGATFANYFVTDSLCCPSRSSIFTGAFRTTLESSRIKGRTVGTSLLFPAGTRTIPSRQRCGQPDIAPQCWQIP